MEHRAIFVSDVHLGSAFAGAEQLLAFLEEHTAQSYYLLGDIIDMWAMQRNTWWPKRHTQVMQKLIKLSRHHRVVYIPGNHDEYARKFVDHSLEGVEIVESALYGTLDNKVYYLTHGDEFDLIVQNHKWLAKIGGHAYDWALAVSHAIKPLQRRLTKKEFSLSRYLKASVKEAGSYINSFEDAASIRAHQMACDGVICGHIHEARLKHVYVPGVPLVRYGNTGDWVESYTAIVEHPTTGELALIDWGDRR